jgi:hypothetical protein
VNRKLLPASIGTYRIIQRKELTPEQLATLRAASAERVRERLCALIGDGRASASQVQAKYGALLGECGRA